MSQDAHVRFDGSGERKFLAVLMEVGLPASPCRQGIPNHRKLYRSRAVVVSVVGKGPA
jgi:hypothetical protein